MISLPEMLRLYFSPGACSLSPHIALREADLPFELVRVDLRAKLTADGADFRAVNPKGYVPALDLGDGRVLTEGVAIVQWIADQRPDRRLAPQPGSFERYRLQEWLNFIATELHKGMSPLYSQAANEEFKSALRERLTSRFDYLAKAVQSSHEKGGGWLLGQHFSIGDGYALYAIRSWQRFANAELPAALTAYRDRVQARPAVKAALEAEGLA